MGIDVDQVGVKATTTEHLGFEGREEGISAQAVAFAFRNDVARGTSVTAFAPNIERNLL